MNNYKLEICNYIDKNWDTAKKDRRSFFDKLFSSKYLCLFGAGGMGIDIANYLNDIGIKVDFFCDNNEKLVGKNIALDIKCISFDELTGYKDDVFILISTGMYSEINLQLSKNGFDMIVVPTSIILKCKKYLDTIEKDNFKNKVCSLFENLYDENSKSIAMEIVKKWFMPISEYNKYNYNLINSGIQYFPQDVIRLSEHEVFVDAGAFDGDTIQEFLAESNSKFKSIIAYELDKKCFEKLKNNIETKFYDVKDKIFIHNKGIYDENKDIKYCSNSTSSSINSFANEIGQVVRLDDHLQNEKVTFIKMDIEGSEVKALNGASKLIVNDKPKLAICVYHEPYHLWEIPLYVKSLVPEYKIYIRHHSDFNVDTVLYAII